MIFNSGHTLIGTCSSNRKLMVWLLKLKPLRLGKVKLQIFQYLSKNCNFWKDIEDGTKFFNLQHLILLGAPDFEKSFLVGSFQPKDVTNRVFQTTLILPSYNMYPDSDISLLYH